MLTSDAIVGGDQPFLPERLRGRPLITAGFVWVGDMTAARAYLDTFRGIGSALAEQADEVAYVDLQSSGDQRHHHGLRRYSAGHYLVELTDAAIDAYVARGVTAGAPDPDWTLMPGGGFQALGGAIAEVGDDESAFSHRRAQLDFFAGATWADPAEDEPRIASARAWAATLEPYSSGVYVNVIGDPGDALVGRAYLGAQHARLAELKRQWDPDNVFHLNTNIRPAAS